MAEIFISIGIIFYLCCGLLVTSFRPYPVSVLSHVKTLFLWLPALFSDRLFIYIDR